MANKVRYIRGDIVPVDSPPILSAVVIEIGDLLYQDMYTKNVYPASSLPDQGGDAANQRLFSCWFLGVALGQSRSGDTASISVGTTGTWEFICPSATWSLGDLVAADGNAATSGLLDQTVEEVFAHDRSIGVCDQLEAVANTRVWVRIRSEVMEAGYSPGLCSGSSSSGS